MSKPIGVGVSPDKSLDKNSDKNTSWLQRWLENIWYHEGAGKYLLLPLSALYCTINYLQRWQQSKQQVKNRSSLRCPIIVVGNITVGGTGKTPLTIHLVKRLQRAGYKPAIITRGYGGKATTWPQFVNGTSDPQWVGDEAVLMAVRTQVPVYAGADRMASIHQIQKEQQCDVIISDDGMQHYKLPRDIQIAVIDGSRMLGNGLCLPAGPLREKQQRLNLCDFIVINGKQKGLAGNSQFQQAFDMRVVGDLLLNLKSQKTALLNDFSVKKIHAVTGIGNPQRFYKTLQRSGLQLIKHSFPDHYEFQASDLEFNDDLIIVMTEKDAVKCKQFANQKIWYLPIKAIIDQSFDQQLLGTLESIKKH